MSVREDHRLRPLQTKRKVYTEIVPNSSKDTLQGIIRGKVALESLIYSDTWRGHNDLVDVGYGKHLRVDHGKDQFVSGPAHINGMKGSGGSQSPG